MSKVSHPNLVHFYGSCVHPKVCIVMGYCSRGSVFHVISSPEYETFDLTWIRVFAWCEQTVLGIKALHDSTPPIYHRDLKTLNLLLDTEWKIKICDFGLARLSEDKNTLGKMRGTPAYCAPELYSGKATYTESSDVYSLAIIFWELVVRCLTGKYQRPYAEYDSIRNPLTILIKAAKDNLRPSIRDITPKPLQKLIKSMWDPEPSQRPSCASILVSLKKTAEKFEKNKESWEDIRVKNKQLKRAASYRVPLSVDDADDLEGFEAEKIHIEKDD